MKIKILEPEFAICQINDLKTVNYDDEFLFLSKTDDEISLVCIANAVPIDACKCDLGWSAFRIDAVLDFSLVGILASITSLLAANQIAVFAISTYNTDYVLVKSENIKNAINILKANGYDVS